MTYSLETIQKAVSFVTYHLKVIVLRFDPYGLICVLVKVGKVRKSQQVVS
jgi:hypothetical protein